MTYIFLPTDFKKKKIYSMFDCILILFVNKGKAITVLSWNLGSK